MIRLCSLGLDSYGVFDGARLPLGKGLTVAVGANETGKSTALNALADLLWGVPLRHPLAELTPRATLRVSAELEHDGTPGIARDGVPAVVVRTGRGLFTGEVPEPAANPWGADGDDRRRHWMTAFGLGHTVLREGGRQVCEGGGDLAELVFTARHGRGVQELLRQLEQRADTLYKDHRGNRSVRLRVAVGEYQHRRRALDQALVRASEVVRAEHEVGELEQRAAGAGDREVRARRAAARLAEHGRCLDIVHAVHRIRGDIAAARDEGAHLDGEDLAGHAQACSVLQDADREHARASEQVRVWTAEREALTVDAAVLADGDLIDDLRAQTRARTEDRGRAEELRQHARAQTGQARGQLVALLGHADARDTSTLLEALTPPADLVAQLDALAAQHPGLLADRQRHVEAVEEDRAALARLDSGAPVPDMQALAPLSDLVRALTAESSVPARLRAARTEQIEAGRRRRQALLAAGALDPDAPAPAPPGEEDVASAAQRVQAATLAADQARERVREAEAALDGHRRRLPDLENARTVRPDTLVEARRRRDTLWSRITRAWVAPTGTGGLDPQAADPQVLVTAFAEQIRASDDVADQLILQAQVDAELTRLQRDIAGAERVLRERTDLLAEAVTARDGELSAWRDRWTALGVAVPSPAQAETVRRALLTAAAAAIDEATARTTAYTIEPEVAELAIRLRSRLRADAPTHAATSGVALSGDRDPAPDVLAVLDSLLAVARSLLDDADRARELQEHRRNAQKALERSQTRLGHSEEALAGWAAGWADLLDAAGLPEVLDPTGWTFRRTRLDAARTTHEEATARDNEADTLLRSWDAFHTRVAELGTRHGLSGGAEHILDQLWPRLAASRADQRTHRERTDAIEEATRRLAELSGTRSAAQARLDDLCLRHGLPGHQALADAADRGERLARLRQVETAQLDTLRTAVDPEHGPEDVVAELVGTDRADLELRAQQAEEELADAQQSRADLIQQLGATKKTLTELQQRGDSADLNARVQEALATVDELAGEYAGLHLQRIILREALEADAARHANPLLQTAGRVLERLTGGQWVALQAEDNGDRRVQAVRHDGQPQALTSLSEGTADQVFLALRLAGIAHRQNERRRAGQVPVPVVLDDVLMAFDDERTANALTTLADVAAGTDPDGQPMQVVLFTHHRHVAGLAEALGRNDVGVVHLEGRPLPEERLDPERLRGSR